MTGKPESLLGALFGIDGLAKLLETRRKIERHQGLKFVSLGTTSNVRNPSLHVGTPRPFENSVTQNIIVKETKLFGVLVDFFRDSVDKVFLDVEKKSRKSVWADTIPLLSDPKVTPFKPNDLAVEAAAQIVVSRCDAQSCSLGIVGEGNISLKLSFLLYEHGYRVRHFTRDVSALQGAFKQASSYLRGFGSFQVKDLSDFRSMSDVSYLLGASNGSPVVLLDHINELPSQAELLDVGNGSFTAEAISGASRRGLNISVLSVEAAWKAFMVRYFETDRLIRAQGRRVLGDGIVLVSRGTLGKLGEILVDDMNLPATIIGVCDGEGDLLYGPNSDLLIEKARHILGID